MKIKNTAHIPFVMLILLQSVVYGFGNPLTKIAYKSITPFWLLSIRFSIAFLIFLIFFGKRIFNEIQKTGFLSFLPASLSMALAYISCNVALSLTKATNVGFMMSLSVIIAPILSRFILKTRYEFRKVPLQLMVLLGVFLLHLNGDSISFNMGDVISIFMAVFLAASLVLGEKSLQSKDAIAVSAMQCGLTALLSLILALTFDSFATLKTVKPDAVFVILYLALFCSCMAYFFQNKALTVLTSSTVSMLQCTQPICTAVVSYFLLGETMGMAAILGSVIIIICLLLVAKN